MCQIVAAYSWNTQISHVCCVSLRFVVSIFSTYNWYTIVQNEESRDYDWTNGNEATLEGAGK